MITSNHWLTRIENRRANRSQRLVEIAIAVEKRRRDEYRAYNVARKAIRLGASDTDAILRDYAEQFGFNQFYFDLENAVYVVEHFGADTQHAQELDNVA